MHSQKESNEAIGGVVQQALHESGMTRASVLRKIGMSPGKWSRRLAGNRPFALVEMHRIARALRLPPGDLVAAALAAADEAEKR